MICLTKYIDKAQLGIGFEIKNEIQDHYQSIPKINVLAVHFGPNLEILTLIRGKVLRGQTQNGVNFDFQV